MAWSALLYSSIPSAWYLTTWAIKPRIHSTATRRATRQYVDASGKPSSHRLASEKGIDVPTRKRNTGMTRSQATNPRHLGCVNWSSNASTSGGCSHATRPKVNSRPPMSQNMAKPRRASRERNRCLGSAADAGNETSTRGPIAPASRVDAIWSDCAIDGILPFPTRPGNSDLMNCSLRTCRENRIVGYLASAAGTDGNAGNITARHCPPSPLYVLFSRIRVGVAV